MQTPAALRPRILAYLAVAFSFIRIASAGWNGSGFVSVPIPPPNQPEPVPLESAGGYALNVIDIEGEVAPGDLEVLKLHPPFAGMKDEEITAKMNIMRRNVSRAIELIAYENPDLSYCLGRLWHERRLCIAFTRRNFGGITNANRFPNPADRCERAAISIKVERVPCDLRQAYDGDMIVLANTMAHEALHVTQPWSGIIPPRPPRNDAEIDLRLQIQNNEIAASEAEKARLDNLNAVFLFISVGRGVPEDDPRQGFRKLPMTIRAVEQFLLHVPEADRINAADAIAKKTNDALLKACQTLDCRRAVRTALEELKVHRDAGTFVRDLRGNRDAAGWASILGNQLLTGVFQTDIIAGGLGDDTNVVRQFVDGAEHVFTLPVEFVTDVIPNAENSFLASGSDEGAGTGTVFLLGDSDGDRVIDIVMPTLVHEYVAGGVTFSPGPAGSLYCFAPGNQMVFQLQLGSDGTFTYPIGISFAGLVGDPDDSLVQRVILSDDGLTGYGITEDDFAIHPGTRWVRVTRPELGFPFTAPADFNPLDSFAITPAISSWPRVGDTALEVSGTAGASLTVEIVDRAGVVIDSGPGSIGGDGFGSIDLPGFLDTDHGVRLRENGFASRALLTVNGAAPTIDPLIIGDRIHLTVQAVPGTVHKYLRKGADLTEHEPFACVQADGFGRTSFTDPVFPPALIGTPPGRGFYCAEIDSPSDYGLVDDVYNVPPGVETTVKINANDRYPHGTVFAVADPPGAPLHQDIFNLAADGTLAISPLTASTQIVFDYTAAPASGAVAATATVTVNVDGTKLYNLPLVVEDLPGTGLTTGYHVPCLRLNAGTNPENRATYDFPVYQFRLANNPADRVKEPHWHSGVVFPVNAGDPGPGGRGDPDSEGRGHGKKSEVAQVTVFVPAGDWNGFLADHPPPP